MLKVVFVIRITQYFVLCKEIIKLNLQFCLFVMLGFEIEMFEWTAISRPFSNNN